jgi:hypothetical protein
MVCSDIAISSVTFQFLHRSHAHDLPERKDCRRNIFSAERIRVRRRPCRRFARRGDNCEYRASAREGVPPIPEPQRYLQRYEMEYQSDQGKPFYAQIENFYSTQVTHDFRFGAGKATPTPEAAPQQASNYLNLGPSTAPQLSMVQLPNATLTLGTQPQRRLSLIVNDWVFSGTARVAVLHSHDTGATLSVRHGF